MSNVINLSSIRALRAERNWNGVFNRFISEVSQMIEYPPEVLLEVLLDHQGIVDRAETDIADCEYLYLLTKTIRAIDPDYYFELAILPGYEEIVIAATRYLTHKERGDLA